MRRRSGIGLLVGALAVTGIAGLVARLAFTADEDAPRLARTGDAEGAEAARDARAPLPFPAPAPAKAPLAAPAPVAPVELARGEAPAALRPAAIVGAGRVWEPVEPAPGEEHVAQAPPGGWTLAADGSLLLNGAPLTVEHPAMVAIMDVQGRHTDALMLNPDVVGTSIGVSADGQLAIVVLTRVDAGEDLPASLDGIPVVEDVTGEIGAFKKPGGGTPADDPTKRFARPVPIGVSCGHFAITAGTIGCRVIDGSGNRFILSNNHVLANENLAAAGDNILQPGPFDGGLDPTDWVADLADFEPIDFSGADNTIDAAIASCTTGDVGTATPTNGGYGTPSSTTTLFALNQTAMKYGRTTRLTTGPVSGLNVTSNVGYDQGTARFVGQILINKRGFSAGGDSGSLIVVQSTRRPGALLFAGGSRTTIGNPIGPVLAAFGVTVDGQ